ncbi:zf-CCHC domain-containing protein [Cucumis melo var. makuwa]|uniref:Zf-CCHC domain-containing protein n=1 Tax=Cucumis melo var. makuwa TaxID=1194695 RepID=A0A5D3BRR5_CUCMM|nr:zf-CCHC domain-containing protein [Cucumis melo var. makuwa]TYK00946.1 zf-CCHC domain-containing protein [Cucumis melo var. makuwa]
MAANSSLTKEEEKDKTSAPNGKKTEAIPKKQTENVYQRPNLSKCFHFGQADHFSNFFPKRKTIAILEEDEDVAEEQEGNFDQDEEILEPDEGETLSCVLQRVLIAPKNKNSHQHRHSLSMTRCTIQSKVCNMIIDSGSSENFVSKKLVTALKLKTEPHSNPYEIEWIKKGGDIQIKEICSVPLLIGGSYKDQIVCDVLDMWMFAISCLGRRGSMMFK